MDKKPLIVKCLAVGMILLFVGVTIAPAIAQNTEKQSVSRGIWFYVGGSGPGNYSRIQDAIDNASDGDTVFVYNGTYYEVLVVNKTFSLIGEDRDTTIIDGGWGINVVDVSSDGVSISGFTIRNGVFAICLVTSSDNTIMDNTASNSGYGISLQSSSNNTVTGNNVNSNSDWGIVLDTSSNNTVTGNIVSNNNVGILLIDSSNNTIIGNTANSNNDYGIILGISNNNIITGNTASNTDFGIYLDGFSNNNYLFHNNLLNNTQNAADDGSNIWDNGYPSGGNYWSDYTGTDGDGDGIGDTPYDIPGGDDQDRYPFMEPNGWVNEPDLHIEFSTTGIGVDAVITNNGTANATGVTWQIHVEGGLLGFIDTTVDGTIDITMCESSTVTTDLFLGLGPFTVTARADDVEETATGMILLFYVLSIT
jgi:nitrous oxidase accessory protein